MVSSLLQPGGFPSFQSYPSPVAANAYAPPVAVPPSGGRPMNPVAASMEQMRSPVTPETRIYRPPPTGS